MASVGGLALRSGQATKRFRCGKPKGQENGESNPPRRGFGHRLNAELGLTGSTRARVIQVPHVHAVGSIGIGKRVPDVLVGEGDIWIAIQRGQFALEIPNGILEGGLLGLGARESRQGAVTELTVKPCGAEGDGGKIGGIDSTIRAVGDGIGIGAADIDILIPLNTEGVEGSA